MSSGNDKPRVAPFRGIPLKHSSTSGTAGKSTRYQSQGERFAKRGSSAQSSQGKKKTSDGEIHAGVSRSHKQSSGGRYTQSPLPKEGSDKGGGSTYDSGGVQGGREEVMVIEHCGKKGGGRSYQKSKQFDQTGGSQHGYKTVSYDSRKDPNKGSKVNHLKAGQGKAQPRTVTQVSDEDPNPKACQPEVDKGTVNAVTSQCTSDMATVVEGDCRRETPDSIPDQVAPEEVEAVASAVAVNGGATEEDDVAEPGREEDEGNLKKPKGITYTRDFLVSKKFLLESTELSNGIKLKLTELGILKGCDAASSSNPRDPVCADPRVSAKVALTPQRKSFGGGCSWRNKVGGSDSQEDNVDGGASSVLRREEAGVYGFEEEEAAGADDEYCFGRTEYKAAPYHGHVSHPLSSGVDRGSERVVRTPRKIDHVPLRDQARRGTEYEEGREQHRGLHQDRSFDEPEWMTFDLGSSNEKFEFGGCDEIERMRNEMKAKLGSNEASEEGAEASPSTAEEPVGEEGDPQYIEAWDELDEDDTIEGGGAIRQQNNGNESAAVGAGDISGTEERGGMGLTDEVLTQLLGFQLDDLEEENLGNPQAVASSARLGFTDFYGTFPEASTQEPTLKGAPSSCVSTTAASVLAGSNPSELLKQMLNIQGNSRGSDVRPVVTAPPQSYSHTHIPNERGHPTTRMLMLDEIEDAAVRDQTCAGQATEEEVVLMMARLAGMSDGVPPGGQPNRMQGLYPPGGVPPLRDPVMECYNHPLSEPIMDGYHRHLPRPPPSGVMGQYYRHLQPSAVVMDPMKSGTTQLDRFAQTHQQSNMERTMLAHAAQVQHHHLQPQRLPMGQQHGLTVNPHFRQSGSMGVPQQQPRYSHHLQQQQGGGKASHMGFMPTSVLRKMASQIKPEVVPAVDGPSHMWQAASVANVAKLEQDLAHKAVKTHETMSDLLTSATAMGFVPNQPQQQQQQQLTGVEEDMEFLLAAAAASGQPIADVMTMLGETSLHQHQGRPMEAYNAGLPPPLPVHHSHQQHRLHHQGHIHQPVPRPAASYMQYM